MLRKTNDIKSVQKEIEESHKEWVQQVRDSITKDLGPIDARDTDTKNIHRHLCDLSLFAMNRFNQENANLGIAPISLEELPHCKRAIAGG